MGIYAGVFDTRRLYRVYFVEGMWKSLAGIGEVNWNKLILLDWEFLRVAKVG